MSYRTLDPNDDRRELGRISAYREDVDVGRETAWVYWESEGGTGGQGFGGFYLPEKKDRLLLERMLTETFGVETINDLKGKECYALRNRLGWGARIVGLESKDTGKIFTDTMLRRALDPKFKAEAEDAKTRAIHDAAQSVEIAERRLKEAKAFLAKLVADENFIDWDKEAAHVNR